jgi:glycosyltransferase involved in cell wall biosynthesis
MKLSVVSPVYNEEAGISEFLLELNTALLTISKKHPNVHCKIVLVDDGSTDSSVQIIKNMKIGTTIQLVELSRNFGHQNALWAGLEAVEGDSYVIALDSDLQDPPKELIRIVQEFVSGQEIVLMRRESRKDSLTKKFFAKAFYSIQLRMTQGRLISNVGDFFGLNPNALRALLSHHEQVKYVRGLISELGFKRTILDYDRQARTAGITHYKPVQMLSLAIASLSGFSITPLIWTVAMSFLGFVLGSLIILYIVYLKFFSVVVLPAGWAFATIVILFMSIFQMIILAIMSLYMARVIQEQKERPNYIVARTWNNV